MVLFIAEDGIDLLALFMENTILMITVIGLIINSDYYYPNAMTPMRH